MKKLRKLLAVAAATVISVCALSAPGAYAIFRAGKDIVFEGYTECEHIFTYNSSNNIHYKCFYKATDKNFKIIEAMNYPSSIEVTVPDDTDLSDIESAVREIIPYAVIKAYGRSFIDGDYYTRYRVYGTDKTGLSDEEFNELNLTGYQAKQICNALKGKDYIESLEFNDCNLTWVEGDFSLPGFFSVRSANDVGDDGVKAYLEAYLEESGLDFTIVKEDGIRGVILDSDLTGDEAFKAMEQLARDNVVIPMFVYLASEKSNSDKIDMFDYVDGDANDDGELDLADAVYIMQSIINPDRYSLTAQGSFNADIVGNGDGVTLSDALAVQEILLGK